MLNLIMKTKSYLISFLLWVFITIWLIFWYQSLLVKNQAIDNNSINIWKTISEKINLLKNKLDLINKEKKEVNYNNKTYKFWEIKEILDTQYIDPEYISGTKMWENALQAYVSALWDPFTVYLTAIDNKSLHNELKWSSNFQWIWAVVTKVPEWIMLEEILKDSPAQKAWLKALDIILKSNWTWLANLPLWKAVFLIKWPAWTEVELTIKRWEKIFKIKVKRAKLKLTSVNDKIIKYKNTKFWYISISSVWEKTYSQFQKDYNNLLSKHINWIILDMRWNGGWYLWIWYEIWATWAKKWDIVVQTRYRNPSENKIFRANNTWKLYWIPTVILINWYTASAWEIITAAIKENNKKTVKLVWTKSFGKWTIQTLKEFNDGSSLKYTIWKWFTPDGKNVCKKWVLPWNWFKPDIEIKFDPKLYKDKLIDNQLNRAKEVLYKMIKK